MAGVLESGFMFLYDLGFFTTVLPFILLYAVLYGLFERANVLKNAEYHAIISFTFSFMTIYNVGLVENINLLIARVGFLFIIIIVLLILTGLMGVHGVLASGITILVIALYLAYVVIEVFIGNSFLDILNRILPADFYLPIIISLLVFGAIIWFILGGRQDSVKEKAPRKAEDLLELQQPKTGLSKPKSVANDKPFGDFKEAQTSRDFFEAIGTKKK